MSTSLSVIKNSYITAKEDCINAAREYTRAYAINKMVVFNTIIKNNPNIDLTFTLKTGSVITEVLNYICPDITNLSQCDIATANIQLIIKYEHEGKEKIAKTLIKNIQQLTTIPENSTYEF